MGATIPPSVYPIAKKIPIIWLLISLIKFLNTNGKTSEIVRWAELAPDVAKINKKNQKHMLPVRLKKLCRKS